MRYVITLVLGLVMLSSCRSCEAPSYRDATVPYSDASSDSVDSTIDAGCDVLSHPRHTSEDASFYNDDEFVNIDDVTEYAC